MATTQLGSQGNISIIDFGRFLDGTERHAVAQSILSSFKETGFVYLVNHGVPQGKIDTMFEWSKKFFSLPLETKQLAPHPASGTHHRGYSSPGLEKVTQHVYDEEDLRAVRAKAADVKESFESGREEDEVMPNIWLPEGVLPGFKEACLDFYWTCRETELNILKALAIAFNLPEDHLTKVHAVADNQLRLLHYPSVPLLSLEKNEITRIAAHSDFGTITLLFQDDIGGLEVEDPTEPGTFKPAFPIPGAVVVNAGDFMARWSNDIIWSTIHRVRAPQHLTTTDGMTPERYSIPYFCSTDFDTIVDCLPGTWSEENPKKYEPISAGGYVLKRLAATY